MSGGGCLYVGDSAWCGRRWYGIIYEKYCSQLLITIETYIWQIIDFNENCIKYQLQQLSFSPAFDVFMG